MIKFRDATLADMHNIAPHIREADVLEVKAGTGMDIEKALIDGFDKSLWTKAIIYKDEVISIFGLSELKDEPLIGIPWMLSKEKMYDLGKVILKESPKFRDLMHSKFKILTNLVHVDNVKSIRWLSWLGFEFLEPVAHGVDGELFTQFVRYKNV